MKRIALYFFLTAVLAFALLPVLLVGCASVPESVPDGPSVPDLPTQAWTNSAPRKLGPGELSTGRAFYFPKPPAASVVSALNAVGAVKQSATAWTLDPYDGRNRAHVAAVLAATRAGAVMGQYP